MLWNCHASKMRLSLYISIYTHARTLLPTKVRVCMLAQEQTSCAGLRRPITLLSTSPPPTAGLGKRGYSRVGERTFKILPPNTHTRTLLLPQTPPPSLFALGPVDSRQPAKCLRLCVVPIKLEQGRPPLILGEDAKHCAASLSEMSQPGSVHTGPRPLLILPSLHLHGSAPC